MIKILAVILYTICLFGCTEQRTGNPRTPARIISLAPSITETLFALGLGERVVGVTSDCNYPPEAREIEKIGAYDNANLERIVALKPDLVFISREHEKQHTILERFRIPVVVIDNFRYASVCSSFSQIGRICGAESAADSLLGLFKSKLPANDNIGAPGPEVLVCVGRDSPGSGQIKSLFAAGLSTFHSDLIITAGGRNVLRDSLQFYSRLSREGLISLSPDIIIDLAPAMSAYNCSLLVNDWKELTRVPAVRSKHVFCISEAYATLPGPRLLLLLDDFKRIISTWNGRKAE